MHAHQRSFISLISGFTVWSLAFIALYALQALGCAYSFGDSHRPLLIAAYVLSLVLLIVPILYARRLDQEEQSALSRAGLWANLAALASGVLVFAPVTFASACL